MANNIVQNEEDIQTTGLQLSSPLFENMVIFPWIVLAMAKK